MVRKRNPLPKYGELVIGTVTKIFEHGAFVSLDEYDGLEAFCPLGEVTKSWFKSIREVLKERQKRVFKVIRVDPVRKHVDVSLRRVADSERRDKLAEWRRLNRAENLLALAAKKLGKTLDDAYVEAGWKLEDYYGEIYTGFEEAARRGAAALEEAGVKREWVSVLAEMAKNYVELPEVSISGLFIIRSLASDGVKRIKGALLTGIEAAKKFKDVKIRIYAEGAPRYKIDLTAPDYKIAEKAMHEIVYSVTDKAKKLGCSVNFQRIKK